MADRLFWKSTRGDLATSRGYRWALPGSGDFRPECTQPTTQLVCDCTNCLYVAKDYEGASTASFPVADTALLVAVPEEHIYAEDEHKARIRSYTTLKILNPLPPHTVLRGDFMTYINIAGVTLDGWRLSDTHIHDSLIQHVSIKDATWRDSSFDGTLFEHVHFHGVFSDIKFDEARLKNCTIQSTFDNAAFVYAYLENCTVTGLFHSPYFSGNTPT